MIVALTLFVPLMAAAQVKKVTGVITDETGEPVIGALAKVVGTTLGTATDVEGRYLIELPAGKDVIEYSYLGYETQTIVIGSNSVMNVKLQPKSFDID
ncbi:MAG: carboxypeptidase-like regulatory domain-containing protein, partial [Bacteroides xylanisolvens]